jgi:uncharacterized repeat protein (TIGR03803 family)
MLALPPCVQAQGYKQLYNFQGMKDGASPYFGLLMYGEELYGTTLDTNDNYRGGTIFKLSNGGSETVLHSFRAREGINPAGPLVVDASGNLFGVASVGGRLACTSPNVIVRGCGTVFRLARDGTLTVLHAFRGKKDGAQPNAGVTIGKNGNLYGTTTFGGRGKCSLESLSPGCGTIFEVAPDGTETVLYAFKGGSADGDFPYSGLLADKAANLYGMTYSGGVDNDFCDGFGCGTVFKLSPGSVETVLYAFCSEAKCADGAMPLATLVDLKGMLYGTTETGGAYGFGTVFSLDPKTGVETILHSFCGNCDDGGFPYSGVVADSGGDLYGTTLSGGVGSGGSGWGVVYKLARDGTETVVYTFCSVTQCTDGANPTAGLLLHRGKRYGTTYDGGPSNCKLGRRAGCGVVFVLYEKHQGPDS